MKNKFAWAVFIFMFIPTLLISGCSSYSDCVDDCRLVNKDNESLKEDWNCLRENKWCFRMNGEKINKYCYEECTKVVEPEPHDIKVVGVKGTGSMTPLIYPDSELEYKKYDGNSKCGHIYIYQTGNTSNETTVHRYVYQGRNGEIYMKGDNNLLYDKPIDEDKILYEIVGIR